MNKRLIWIYILSGAIYFTQGIEGLPGLSLFLFLKEHLHFSPEKIMYISAITGLAWIIKPIWGFLIDNYMSFKKWITLSLLGSIAISLFLGLNPVLTLPIIIITGLLANYNAASRDVAVDAIMCVEGKETKNCDKIQAIQWICITIASIAVGLGGGYIAQHYDYRLAYLCLIPIYLIISYIALQYKTDKILATTEVTITKIYEKEIEIHFKDDTFCLIPIEKINDKSLLSYGQTINYQVMITPDGVKYEKFVNFKNSSKNILKICSSYIQLFTDKKFLLAALFLFLYKFSPSFGTPLSFIERDVFKWSAQWMGTLGAIVSCFEILGAIIFFKYCKQINIKRWLTISVFLGATTTISYLYFTPVSAVIYGIMYAILGMFVHLIVMSFLAQSTISGKEATSFALLCSVNNFAAGTASSLSGAYLYPIIGLQPLIIISAVTSFLCLPIIRKLKIGAVNE